MKEIHDSSIHRVFLYPWLSPRQAALWGATAGAGAGVERGIGGVKSKEQRFVTLLAEELPPGWTLATIGEMIDVDGVFTDGDWVVSKDQDPDGDVRLVQLADISDGFWLNKSNRYLTYEKAIELGCTFLEPGDVLIARMPDPLGRACIFPGDSKRCITAVDVCIVRTGNQDINHRWLMHTINSPAVRVVVESLQSGSTRKRISRKNLGRIEFPLPPSPEQRRIVAEIETQFTRLDAGVAALERAQANLKRYRSSVLKAACEGRLVPTEAELARADGRAYEPADQLLARILAERRVRWEAKHPGKKYKEPAPPDTEGLPELPEGWAWVAVEQIGEVQLGRQRSPKYHQGPNMRPYLRAANATWNGVDLSDVKEMDFPPEIWGNYRLQKDDILLAEASGSPNEVGKPFIWKEQIAECGFQNTLIRVQLCDLAPDFVHIHFLADATTGRFGGVAKGVNIQHLGANRLSRFVIALPPLPEQHRIVAEVERRLSVVAALEREVEAALARAARLRRSILKRAFEGRLVPQDPSDEPASVLLERIKTERKAGKGKSIGREKQKPEKPQQLEMF